MEISVNIKDDYLKWLHEISKETSTDKEELIKTSIIKYVQDNPVHSIPKSRAFQKMARKSWL